MRVIETGTLPLDGNTLRYIADDLWRELNGMEAHYPQVLDDADYARMKAGFVEGSYISPDQQNLERLYGELIECLGKISTQTTNVFSLAARKDRAKSLADYLPRTFKDFVDRVTEARLQAEYFENAYEGAAEALFMSEVEGGIDSIVPRHREEVQARVYEMLVGNSFDGNDANAVDRADMSEIFKLMGISDEWDLLAEAMERGQIYKRIAEIILFIREELVSEYANVDSAELRLKKPTTGDLDSLSSGIKKLLAAMAQHESRYGSRAEMAKAMRLEFARRVIMPPLKVAEDRRMGIGEALREGLTTEEARILLFLGHLKPLGEDEALEHHDLRANDPITGNDLEAIERRAVARLRTRPTPPTDKS